VAIRNRDLFGQARIARTFLLLTWATFACASFSAACFAAPMRYELDLTPTATHASYSWDHDVPVTGNLNSNCGDACHTGAAGDFAPSGTVNTPSRSGTFLLAGMKLRYYGDSSGVRDYPDSITGNTATAQGHYLASGRATVMVPLAGEIQLRARSVAVGQSVCAIVANGGVKCWGRNRFGGLGNGTDQDSTLPVPTIGLPNSVKQISGYFRHSCAVTRDGAVWCWGSNNQSEVGNSACPWQTDFGDCTNPTPSQVPGLPGPAASVSVGGDFSSAASFSCANLLAGTVWCWGGDAAQPPTQVAGLSGVKSIGAKAGTVCAVVADGTVWCWGTSLQGPAQVPNLTAVVAVSGSCALRSDGTVWCWYDAATIQTAVPSQVAGLSGLVSIADSSIYADPNGCAVRSDGTVWCWGRSLAATQVSGLTGVTAIARGGDYADVLCAIRYDRTLWCLYDNEWGQLGNPTVGSSSVPVPVLAGASRPSANWESPGVFAGSFDPVDGLFVSTDNTHHSIGVGSGWPTTGPASSGLAVPPFSPTYPGGIMSNQYSCDPGNPDDNGCGPNASAIDGYDLRSPLVSATGHKLSNQDFPADFPAKNGPLWLIGGGAIEIDPIAPTDAEHSSVGYTGSFSATALTPLTGLVAFGGASGATATENLYIKGTFVLGSGANAYSPVADDIVIGYGPYTAYLPAGTLHAQPKAGAAYSGSVNGSPLQISIRQIHDSTYAYSIAVQSVDLRSLVAPANLELYIGDNAGSAPVLRRH
jgi:alpha-tubulin suppressor-like RCC1 family protein